eukprot:scaffold7523_cov118-Cylindrotheca_fusiformis.AAC.1
MKKAASQLTSPVGTPPTSYCLMGARGGHTVETPVGPPYTRTCKITKVGYSQNTKSKQLLRITSLRRVTVENEKKSHSLSNLDYCTSSDLYVRLLCTLQPSITSRAGGDIVNDLRCHWNKRHWNLVLTISFKEKTGCGSVGFSP